MSALLDRAIESGRVSRATVTQVLAPFGEVSIEKQERDLGGRSGFSRWHIAIKGGRSFNGDTLLEAFEDACAALLK